MSILNPVFQRDIISINCKSIFPISHQPYDLKAMEQMQILCLVSSMLHVINLSNLLFILNPSLYWNKPYKYAKFAGKVQCCPKPNRAITFSFISVVLDANPILSSHCFLAQITSITNKHSTKCKFSIIVLINSRHFLPFLKSSPLNGLWILDNGEGKTRGPGGPWGFLKYWLIAKVCFVSLSFACLNHQYLNGWHQRLWILAKGERGEALGIFWVADWLQKSKSQLGSSLSSKAMTDRLTKDCPKGFFSLNISAYHKYCIMSKTWFRW